MKKRALAALLICAISISSYASDRLNLGQKLYFGQNIESPNGQYRLHMESDQRLVLRQNGVEIWHVKGQYSEDRGAVRAELRSILGIVSLDLINYRDEAVWSNPRWNYPSGVVPRLTHLQVQNDGNVVLYTRLPVWESATYSPQIPGVSSWHLKPGEEMPLGTFILLGNGQYTLAFQADGNLVIYKNGGVAIWSSNTQNRGATKAKMQSDGNFVIYANETPIWATNTDGRPNSALAFQPDGNLVLYHLMPIWARFGMAPGFQPGPAEPPSTFKIWEWLF